MAKNDSLISELNQARMESKSLFKRMIDLCDVDDIDPEILTLNDQKSLQKIFATSNDIFQELSRISIKIKQKLASEKKLSTVRRSGTTVAKVSETKDT